MVGKRTKYVRIGLIVTLASILYALPGGYQISVTNTVQPVLEGIVRKQLNMSQSDTGGEQHRSGRVSIYISTIAAAHPLGCVVGSSAASYLGDRLGPLRTLGGLVATIYLGSSVLLGVAMKLEYLWLIIVARILFGIGAGMNNVLTHVYVAEISPSDKRAIFNSILKCAISVGNLIANILGLQAILGTINLLPELFGITGVPGLCGMVCLLFLPETPGHYVKKQQLDKANDSILKLLGNQFTEAERTEVLHGLMTNSKTRNSESVDSVDDKKNDPLTWSEIMRNPKYRKPFFIAMILSVAMTAAAQPMKLYSTEVFLSYGLAEATAQYLTIGIYVVQQFGMFSSIVMVHKLSRRQLFMVGLGMITISQFLLAFIPLIPNHFARITLQTACWCTTTFFQMVAISPLRTLLPLEVCQTELRVKAFGIAISNARVFQAVAIFATYPLFTVIHSWIFLLFASFSFAMLIYTYTTVPETQNKTFHEISKHWEQYDRRNKTNKIAMQTADILPNTNKVIVHDTKF